MTGRPPTAGLSQRRPRVSVVVPVRDGAAVVARACWSALGQRHVDVELIVVENGSRDDTVAVVESLRDERLLLIRHDGVGVSSARNRGMAAATGEWVAFLDADDAWAPDKLHGQLATSPGELVFGDCRMVTDGREGERTFASINPPPRSLRGDGPQLLRALLRASNFIPLSTVVADRAVLERVGGFRPGLHHAEDWELWLRLALAGTTWSRTPDASTDYAIHPHGASRDLRAMYAGEARALQQLMPQLVAAGVGDLARRRLRKALVESVVYGRSAGSTPAQRVRDLHLLLRNRPGYRAVLRQLQYTVRSTPPRGR